MKREVCSRRDFMKGALAAGAAFTILGASARGQGKSLKVGLIGCGGRGRGALAQHLQAAKILNDRLNLGIDLKVVATADWFPDRALAAGKPYGVPEAACFGGPDAYKRLIEAGPDIVLMAEAPAFRPIHFEAVVKAGKHVFFEKPIAVDPPGCRKVLALGEEAAKKGLVIVAGTNSRHVKANIETQAAVTQEKALGEVLAGRIGGCIGHMFARKPIEPKTADDLVRTWQDWVPLSGDFIVEQHIHMTDLANWFLGRPPVAAVGFGGRARRVAGNQYDFFSVDFDYGNGVHIHSMSRQMNGCWNWGGIELMCEKGVARAGDGPKPKESPIIAEVPYELDGKPISGHLQEHIHLLYYLLKGKPLNQTRDVAFGTAAAIMGRISAYTGQRVLWTDVMDDPAAAPTKVKRNPDFYGLTLRPTAEDFEKGTVEIPAEGLVPLPGYGDAAPGQEPARKARKGKK